MEFTASQIALLLSGKIEGNENVSVSSFGKIEEAKEGEIAFLANPKYEDYLYQTKASIVIVNESLELKKAVHSTLIRVPNAYAAFATLLGKYQEFKSQQPIGIQEPSHIHTSVKIGKDVFIGAFAYISENVTIADGAKIYPGVFIGNNVVIGKNCTIHAGVKIYFDCQLGDNVIIHAGTVIGSDGFGFAPLPDGTYRKVPQIGNVVIENGVEIGANVTIDRATIGSTIIRKGVKIDNLVQVAHNVQIDEDSVVAAQTGISGSTKIGKKVMIGGQTGIVGHITIADGSKINGKSGITKSITKPNMSFNGIPATDFTSSLRSQAALRRLPDLEKKIAELESAIKTLMEKNK